MAATAIFFMWCRKAMTGTDTAASMRWYEFGIVKADDNATYAAPWIIFIKASTPRIDFDRERVPQEALQKAAAYHLSNGKITYEHVDSSNRHDASLLIGEPLAIEFPPDGSTLIKAKLYPYQPQAQYVWNVLRSGGTLRASIGGNCSKRIALDGVTEIPSIFWTHTAVTAWPVNNDTVVKLEPFGEFVKALSTASATPLVLQDLEGSRERGTPSFEQRCTALAATLQQQYPTLTEAEARRVALALLQRRGASREAYVSTPPGVVR
jgi:hypothetical protein